MNPAPIRRFPDPVLKRATRSVGQVDASVVRLVDLLVGTMRRFPRCVGLAAPQIGSDLRIAVMDSSGHPKAGKHQGLLVLINPQIEAAEGSIAQREGCLSIPDFTADVRRAARVHIRAFDRFGSSYEAWLDGFEAVIAQHEIDHLDGKLFLDRVANVKTDVFRRKNYS